MEQGNESSEQPSSAEKPAGFSSPGRHEGGGTVRLSLGWVCQKGEEKNWAQMCRWRLGLVRRGGESR